MYSGIHPNAEKQKWDPVDLEAKLWNEHMLSFLEAIQSIAYLKVSKRLFCRF